MLKIRIYKMTLFALLLYGISLVCFQQTDKNIMKTQTYDLDKKNLAGRGINKEKSFETAKPIFINNKIVSYEISLHYRDYQYYQEKVFNFVIPNALGKSTPTVKEFSDFGLDIIGGDGVAQRFSLDKTQRNYVEITEIDTKKKILTGKLNLFLIGSNKDKIELRYTHFSIKII